MHRNQNEHNTPTAQYATMTYLGRPERKGRPRLSLTDAEISEIHEIWMAGVSINAICRKFRHGTDQVRKLAEDEGWPSRAPRDPLPAGHPLSWGAICRGTSLEGVAFQRMA